MARVLVLFAHPRFEQSRTNAALLQHLPQDERCTFRDLYELYPDFQIDVRAEQEQLLRHEVILWHHPFYWYSSPPLLKQWIDLVLQFQWAYGPGGTRLSGKQVMNVITAGGGQDRYQPEGANQYSVREFLRPFEQTARLCHMEYLPPFVVHGTHRLDSGRLRLYGLAYHHLLTSFLEGEVESGSLSQLEYLNQWPPLAKVLDGSPAS